MDRGVVEYARASDVRMGGHLGKRHEANINYLLDIYERRGQEMLNAFRLRGQREKEMPWDGEYAGKWLDAAAKSAASTGHRQLTEQVNSLSRSLRSAQEPDGYMGIESPEQKGRAEWDVWNQWYALTGWLTHYEEMGDQEALKAADRAGEWLVKQYSPVEGENAPFFKAAHLGGCNVDVIDQLVRLYELSGRSSFLEFVKQIVDHYPPIEAMRRTGKPVVELQQSGGQPYRMHAYVLLAYLGGLAKFAVCTGSAEELRWIESVWEELHDQHLYPTGSLGYNEALRWDSPNDSPDTQLQETCATVEWMLFNQRLYWATGKIRYVHALEQTIYNALLGAQAADGMMWDYFTPLRYHKRWGLGPTRCCFWSGPRGIAMLPELIFGSDSHGVFVNLFEQSEALLHWQGQHITISQATDYPANGSIALRFGLKAPLEFAVRLRTPPWARSVEVAVNGRPAACEITPGEYVSLTQAWHNGDCVEMSFEIPTHTVPMGHYGVAVARGPEIMSVDSRDGEERPLDTVRMDKITVPTDMRLAPGDAADGRRRYAGNVLVDGNPATALFTPYANAGGVVAPHPGTSSVGTPTSALLTAMLMFEESSCFRTIFPKAC